MIRAKISGLLNETQDMLLAYLKVLSWHSPRKTEDNYETMRGVAPAKGQTQ
jgi:hypothetical protein